MEAPVPATSPPSYFKHGHDISTSQPNLNLRSKIFELSNICDTAKVSNNSFQNQ